MDFLVQVASLVGAALILGAYLNLQRGHWRADNRVYLWLNLLGALTLTAVGIWDRRMGFVLLEGVWAAVSLWSIVRPRGTVAPG